MLTSHYRRALWTSPASLLLAFSVVLLLSCRWCEGHSPSAAALSRARELIRETPSPFESSDPLAEMRVVNCLYSLGMEQTISLLREIAPEERSTVHDPEDTEEAEEVAKYEESLWDAQKVCTIVPLLFAVEQGGMPPPADWYDKDKRQWSIPCGTLVIQDGIPFNTTRQWMLEGGLITTLPLVEWAAAHGKLRETPLDPQDDPLQAADILHFRVVARAVPQFPAQCWIPRDQGLTAFRDHLRAQAIKLLPKEVQDGRDLSWDELRRRVARTGVHWDRDSQAYVTGGDSGKQPFARPK
jgi:hypothetical protein